MTPNPSSNPSTGERTATAPLNLRAAVESLAAPLVVAARDGSIRYRNARARDLLADGDRLDTAFAHARFLGSFDGWSAELVRVIEGGRTRRFGCAIHREGHSVPTVVTVECSPLNSPGDAGVVIVMFENAASPALDEQHEVARRLTSLGKLSARVAHELTNPLDGILRYINLALRVADGASESKLKSYLFESRTGLLRMVDIITDLLEFSRTTVGDLDAVNINDVVEQAIRATMDQVDSSRVVVTADYQSKDMPSVRGSRLHQVCCNLFHNAIDAMPDGGRLTITCGLVQQDVVIRVADTGSGLPKQLDSVFEPFFTTKEPGKGTGLGLAICKDFIEDMNGTITVRRADDGGAVFTVRIPVASCEGKVKTSTGGAV